jgi:hypothetical protein
MKMRNEDLVKLNELKFDFLSPPYSFRLANLAASDINAAIEIMKQYVTDNDNDVKQLKEIKSAIESETTDMQVIRKLCKEAAAVITHFTVV